MSTAREVRLAMRAAETLRTHLRQARWLHRMPPSAIPRWESLQIEATALFHGLGLLEERINEAEAQERAALRKQAKKARAA